MSTPIDPYVEWLGVTDPQRPLNYYQLLGLSPLESRLEQISQSAQRLIARVQSETSGPHGSLARRTLFELESAMRCLLDPQKRAAYDALLQGKKSAATRSPQSAVQRQTADQSVAQPAAKKLPPSGKLPAEQGALGDLVLQELETPAPTPSIQWPAPALAKPRQLNKPLLAVCGGAVAAVLLLLMVYVFWPAAEQVATTTSESSEASAKDNLPSEGTGPKSAPLLPAIKPGNSPVFERPRPVLPPPAPASSPPNPLVVPTQPVPQIPFQNPAPHPSPPFQVWQGLPTQTELPLLEVSDAKMEGAPLGRFMVTDVDTVECRLLGNSLVGSKDEPKRLLELNRQVAAGSLVWEVSMVTVLNSKSEVNAQAGTHSVPIAQFVAEKQELMFRWLPEAIRNSGNDLRNCVLELRLGEQRHRMSLRTVEAVPLVLLDLDEEQFQIPLSGEWLPPLDWLQLELGDLGNFSNVSVYPDVKTVGKNDVLRIVLKNDPPSVEIRLRLVSDKKGTRVQILPVIVDTNGKTTLPFSTNRVNTMARALVKELDAARARLATLQATGNALQNEARQVANSSLDPSVKAAALQGLEANMQNAITEANALIRKIPILETRLAVLPGLAAIGNQVHEKGTIKFRVYFDCENHQVDLLRAE